jgi:hypothetical protein
VKAVGFQLRDLARELARGAQELLQVAFCLQTVALGFENLQLGHVVTLAQRFVHALDLDVLLQPLAQHRLLPLVASDGSLEALDVLVERREPRLEIAAPLLKDPRLQQLFGVDRRASRRLGAGELRLEPLRLRIEARVPHAQLREIGARERRIEHREPRALLHDLADLDVDAADHRRFERLHDDGRSGSDELATADDDAIDLGE